MEVTPRNGRRFPIRILGSHTSKRSTLNTSSRRTIEICAAKHKGNPGKRGPERTHCKGHRVCKSTMGIHKNSVVIHQLFARLAQQFVGKHSPRYHLVPAMANVHNSLVIGGF